MSEPKKLDLPAVRALLEKSHGREYWRSLEDLAQTDAFQDLMHREFPRYASEWEDGDSRRNFIKLMGASGAGGVDRVYAAAYRVHQPLRPAA